MRSAAFNLRFTQTVAFLVFVFVSSHAFSGVYVFRFDEADRAHTIRGGGGRSAPHFEVFEKRGGQLHSIGKYSPNGVGWEGSKPLSRSTLKQVIAQNTDEILRMLKHPLIAGEATVFDEIAIKATKAATAELARKSPLLTRAAVQQVVKSSGKSLAKSIHNLFLRAAGSATGGLILDALLNPSTASAAEIPTCDLGPGTQLLLEMEQLRLAQAAVLCERHKKALDNSPSYLIIREDYKESFVENLFKEHSNQFNLYLQSEAFRNCRTQKELMDQMRTRGEFLQQPSTPRNWKEELCQRGDNGFTLKGYEEEFERLNEEISAAWQQDRAAQADARNRNPRAAVSSH